MTEAATPGGGSASAARPADRPPDRAAAPTQTLRRPGNAYNIFILVLTIFSLVLMVLLLLPVTPAERDLLTLYDNAVCVIFLIDFAMNLAGAKPRRGYFIGQRGWLDLLGSIPTFGFIPFTALFRLARLSRLARITRLLRGQAGKDLVLDVLTNRSQYATFITVLLGGIVLSTGSILVLEFESRTPGSNIETGGQAIWWGLVTITTVGYGDYYPVSTLGRMTGVFVMFAGIGIIGALASILASLLVSSAQPEPEETEVAVPVATAVDPVATVAITDALAGLRAEIASQRAEISALRTTLGGGAVAD